MQTKFWLMIISIQLFTGDLNAGDYRNKESAAKWSTCLKRSSFCCRAAAISCTFCGVYFLGSALSEQFGVGGDRDRVGELIQRSFDCTQIATAAVYSARLANGLRKDIDEDLGIDNSTGRPKEY